MSQRLALLIERSADLKRDLVPFAQGPRFERPLTAALQDAVGPEGKLDEAMAIGVTDWFALQHRLPGGDTVVDRFVASRPDLTAADREMLLGWRNPVNFTWSEHGETLLHRRKAWYYEREPLPGFSMIGARLSELRARRS